MIKATEADKARFMAKVEKLDCGCWYWTGARSRGKGNQKFYGSFHVGGKTVRAHRFASEVFNGDECPPGHHRDHTCNFSMCVNPAHIEVITREENQRRKMAREKGRLHDRDNRNGRAAANSDSGRHCNTGGIRPDFPAGILGGVRMAPGAGYRGCFDRRLSRPDR